MISHHLTRSGFAIFFSVYVATTSAEEGTGSSGWYVSAKVGEARPSGTELNSGGQAFSLQPRDDTIYGAGFGYQFTTRNSVNRRLDAEIIHLKQSIDSYSGTAVSIDASSSLDIKAIMFNGELGFDTRNCFTPQISAGVGISIIEFDTLTVSQDDNAVWSAQIKAGVAYQPTWLGRNSLDLTYRYFHAEDAVYRFGRLKNYSFGSIELGFKFEF